VKCFVKISGISWNDSAARLRFPYPINRPSRWESATSMPRIQNADLAKPGVICQAEEAHILALSTKLETLSPREPLQ